RSAARPLEGARPAARRDHGPREPALTALAAERIRVAEVELDLRRPADPEALLDEEAFADDEFLPYWAELWPAGLALARALPEQLDGVQVIELGCGLGIPGLVAGAR